MILNNSKIFLVGRNYRKELTENSMDTLESISQRRIPMYKSYLNPNINKF